MTTVVAGWVVVVRSPAGTAEGCKMINIKREGIFQRQGYPLFTPLYAAVSVYMKGEIQFEMCAVLLHQTAKKKENNREKNVHIFNTQVHLHTHTRTHTAYHLWPSISAVKFAPRIVSSWVFSDQWEATQVWSHVCRRWVTDSWDCGKVTPGGQCTLSPAVCVCLACVCHSCSMSEDCQFFHSYSIMVENCFCKSSENTAAWKCICRMCIHHCDSDEL